MVEVEPIVFIKNFDYDNFLKNYNEGKYYYKTLNKKIKFKNISLLDNNYGNDLSKGKCYLNIGNQKIKCVTDNNFIDSKGEFLQKGGTCNWCRRKYEENGIGIPIKIINKDNKIFYLMDGNYCCFECAYAGIIAERNFRDLWKDSETLLKLIFTSIYPDKKLLPAKDWKLLDINGGCYTEDQFFNEDKHLYTKSYNYMYFIKNIFV